MPKLFASTVSLAVLAFALPAATASAAPIAKKSAFSATDMSKVAGCVRGYHFNLQAGRCVRNSR